MTQTISKPDFDTDCAIPKGLRPATFSMDGRIIYVSGDVQDMNTDQGYLPCWKDENLPFAELQLKRIDPKLKHDDKNPRDKNLYGDEKGLYYISWHGHSFCSRQLRLSLGKEGEYVYQGAITQRRDPPGSYWVENLGSYSLADRKVWEKAASQTDVKEGTTSLTWVLSVMENAIEDKVFTEDGKAKALKKMDEDAEWRAAMSSMDSMGCKL
ncbi:unnamed protein product [Somion occarium]